MSSEIRYEEVKNIFVAWFASMMESIFNSTANSNMIVLIGPESSRKMNFFMGMVPERIKEPT
jgi:hypothetical protein